MPTENEWQKTLKRPVELCGHGLHSGASTSVRILPAPVDHGIVFVRTDLGPEARIPARLAFKADLPRRTAIKNGDAEVHTVEHLLAPLFALRVDNALIEIDGLELPGLDGSGLDFLRAIRKAEPVAQEKPARVFRLRRAVSVCSGSSSAFAAPEAGQLAIAYTMHYGIPSMPTQFFSSVLRADSFCEQLAPARTFVLEQEVAPLRAMGLGRGANLQNTLVVGADGMPLENTLRFPDEYVRHKVLDMIGDLALLGGRLEARVVGVRSGHALNAALAAKIAEACAEAHEGLELHC